MSINSQTWRGEAPCITSGAPPSNVSQQAVNADMQAYVVLSSPVNATIGPQNPSSFGTAGV